MSAVRSLQHADHDAVMVRHLRIARERIEELEDEVRLLRAARTPATRFPLEWKLSPAEERLLAALLTMDTLSHASCLAACRLSYDAHPSISSVTVCKLRKKLAGAGSGVVVETVWGRGYRLVNRAELQRRFS